MCLHIFFLKRKCDEVVCSQISVVSLCLLHLTTLICQSVWHKVTPVTIWDNRYFKQPSVMTAPSLSISITNARSYIMSQTLKTQNELGTRNQTRHVDENYWRQNCAIWSTTRFAFKYLCKTYEILVYKIITAFNAAFSSVKLEKTKWYAMFSPSL